MAVSVCPTVTAEDPSSFRQQIESIANYATRIHIDVSDGIFTPNKLVDIDQVWWPGGVRADLHVMYQRPFEHTDNFLALAPQMVIVQAEGEGNFYEFANTMHQHGIEVGVALLPDTPVSLIKPATAYIDHILIFSGHLGHFGGEADLALLSKAKEIQALSRRIEIGWDGGINDKNAKQLTEGGVQVLNVGGFIHHDHHPENAYATLKTIVAAEE